MKQDVLHKMYMYRKLEVLVKKKYIYLHLHKIKFFSEKNKLVL